MINHKNINNKFESWGNSQRELPPNNEILKRRVLSSIPLGESKPMSRTRVPSLWVSYAFTAMAVITLVVSFGQDEVGGNLAVSSGSYALPTTRVVSDESFEVSAPKMKEQNNSSKTVSHDSAGVTATGEFGMTSAVAPVPAPDMYRYEPIRQNPPITDNREFLKINYNATLKTRHISDLMNRTEIAVRGFDGRVDSLSSSDKWGHVSFAIPKNKFDAFREEITSMVGSRFIIEQTNSQNLLSTKQVIEENQQRVDTELTRLKNDRAQVIINHNQNISLYQMRINSINLEITTLRIEYKTATAVRQVEILNRINEMQVEIGNVENEIISENVSYNSKLGRLDSQIKSYGEASKEIRKQDNDLVDEVATVTGTISFSQISLWEMIDTYVPGPFLAWILFALAIVAYLWHRRYVVAW